MSGGYDGYLDSLRKICEIVEDRHPTSVELTEEISKCLGVTQKAAGGKESFLRKAGVIEVEEGLCRTSQETRQWLETGKSDILIAILHGRCRFIGEIMAEMEKPLTTEALRSVASNYGLMWKTNSQIDNRRGWLQSAGLISVTDDRQLVLTKAGERLTARLEIHRPDAKPESPTPSSGAATEVEKLAGKVIEASTDTGNQGRRFEQAIQEAFASLGFDAQLLGGKGKTDVLLSAPVSKGGFYRVAVDAKTTGSGALTDTAVDWPTLVEHRTKHNADYSLVVGPSPSGGRLMDRAKDHKVAVISARQLSDLCRQHADAPLGLADYRTLFAKRNGMGEWVQYGGEVDTSVIEEVAEEAARMRALATAVVGVLAERCMRVGRLSARDCWIILDPDEVADGSSGNEVQALLDMLAHPLVRAVDGDAEKGYTLSSKPAVTQLRLQHLASSIGSST